MKDNTVPLTLIGIPRMVNFIPASSWVNSLA